MKYRLPRWAPALLAILCAVGVGLAARLPWFAAADFPLNDGALFLQMSREVAAAGFSLPTRTAYNFDDIPFAYPPLAFYVTAGLAALLQVDTLQVVRYLPLAVNLAAIVTVYFLAASLLASRWAVFAAAVAFAGAPRGYEWLIMGG